MFDDRLTASEGDGGARSVPGQALETPGVSPFGRRAFIAGVAGAAAATAVSGTVQAAVPSGASYFEAVGPIRVADTRTRAPYTNQYKGFQRLNDRTIRIDIRGRADIPNDAVAVVVSVAAEYQAGKPGWVKAVPAGTDSEVSNINMENGDSVVANLCTVKIPSNGFIDIKGHFAYDVVVDISGVYRSTSSKRRSGRTEFLGKVVRVRTITPVRKFDVTFIPIRQVPSTAQSVIVNLTAAYSTTDGFFTAYAGDQPTRPDVSNLNWGPGDTRAAGAIVKLGKKNGVSGIQVYSHGVTNLLVDVSGYITGETDAESDVGLFVPINPYRVLDSRRAADTARAGGKRRLWPNWRRRFELPNGTNGFPAKVGGVSPIAGVAMNATVVYAMRLGFVTVLPAWTTPDEVSNLNVSRVNHIAANHAITRVSTAGVEMLAHCGGDVIADIAGWYTGTPQPQGVETPDPPAPAAPFNWVLTVPRMGFSNFVIPNLQSGDPVVDGGNTWHWTNTGLIGTPNASIVVFGHRTSKNGPYRNQHLLVGGDKLVVDTPDQRRYTYTYAAERLTSWRPTEILNAARGNAPGTTFTLVSCTGRGTPQYPGELNDQPGGGIAYRLVTTFVLESWVDTSPTTG